MDYDNEDSIPQTRLALTVLASVDITTPCQEKANQLYDCCSHQLRFSVPPPECPKRQ
ncbi:hypothetical protein Peur_063730 [Populus x canadensis]